MDLVSQAIVETCVNGCQSKKGRTVTKYYFAYLLGLVPVAGMAITPLNGGLVSGATQVTINNSDGDQTLPHVSGNLAAYTDVADGHIHYYDFTTGVDAFVPPDGSLGDTLSDVNGTRVAFTRQTPTNDFEAGIFDVTSLTTTLIDPHPGDLRLGSVLGGNTLVYVDFGTGTGSGDIFAVALPSGTPVLVSGSPLQEQNPNVSPAGDVIVWEQCPTPSNCDVMMSTLAGGVWSAPTAVVNTSFSEENPDTDGVNVVYDADRGAATGQDVFIHPLTGGAEIELELPGTQVNPSISSGVIGFESTVPPATTADIYVYVIATNTMYQVTNTPSVNESLNDISVLPSGQVRVVWAADDGMSSTQNIYATTFTVPLSNPTNTPGCATGFGTGFGPPVLNSPKSLLPKVSAFAFAAEYQAGSAGPIGALGFVDRSSGVSLISSNLTRFIANGSHVTIQGTGSTNGGAKVSFQADADDLSTNGSLDTFSIEWPGYAAGGLLTTGNIALACH